jgi:hypothetical protein
LLRSTRREAISCKGIKIHASHSCRRQQIPDIENQAKVNVNIPLSVAKKAAGLLSLVPKDVKTDLNDKGINLECNRSERFD